HREPAERYRFLEVAAGPAVKQRLGLLIGSSLVLWLVLVYPAHPLSGRDRGLLASLGGEPVLLPRVILYSAVAVCLCLVPTVATLFWAGRSAQQAPPQQLLVMLVGTGIRLAFVLGVGLILYSQVPAFEGRPSFWAWVLV